MKPLSLAAAQARVARLTAAPNHSMFELAPFEKRGKPHCLYLYYITNITRRRNTVYFQMKVYYHDNGGKRLGRRKVKKLAPKLVLNARRDCLTNTTTQKAEPKGYCPPLCGTKFDDVKWRRKSYILVVVDDPHWWLARHAGNKVDPILVNAHSKTCNHNFFGAFEWSVEMPHNAPSGSFDHHRTAAVAFRNHMVRDEAGSELGDEEQEFSFDINVENQRGDFLPVPIDPDGSNLGPPLGPP
jgi:hypothetical protein